MMPFILTEQLSAATYLWAVCAPEVHGLRARSTFGLLHWDFLRFERLGRATLLLHCLYILVFGVTALSQIYHILSPALADPHFPRESEAVE